MARRKSLNVWLHGVRVGAISTDGRPGNLEFRYSDAALDRWSGGQPVLSCAFPLSNGRYDANAWFRGLLPEGRAREAMVAAANVAALYPETTAGLRPDRAVIRWVRPARSGRRPRAESGRRGRR